MDKYILELIKLHSKIILPEFGAIVISDDETGEVMFNEYLNYNDNKLAELVEQESNMDIQEAQNAVAKFVRDLKYQLDKGENYTIYQLGEFYKEKEEYMFSGNINTGKSDRKAESLPPVFSKEVEEEIAKETTVERVKKEEPKKEEEEKENKIPPSVTSSQPEKNQIKSSDKKEGKKNTYKEAEKKDTSDPVSTEKKEVKQKETPPITSKPIKKEKESEEVKRKPFKNLFFLLLSILIVFLAIYFNQDRITQYMGWDKFDDIKTSTALSSDEETLENEVFDEEQKEEGEEGEEETSVVSLDENAEEIEEVENIEKTPEVVENKVQPQVHSSSSGNYHIIVGAFSEEGNAQSLVDELKSKNFSTASIIGQFTSQNLYYVAAGSYSSMADAQSNLSKVQATKQNAWIFKR